MKSEMADLQRFDFLERAIAGEVGRSPATHRHQQGATLLPRQANHVLPQ
jgi:hypothetical protein